MAPYDELLLSVNASIAKLNKEGALATARMLDAHANAQDLREQLAGDPAVDTQKLAEIAQWEKLEAADRDQIAYIDGELDNAEKTRDLIQLEQDKLEQTNEMAEHLGDAVEHLVEVCHHLPGHQHHVQQTIATVGQADHPPVGQQPLQAGMPDLSVAAPIAVAAAINVAKETYDRVVESREARIERLIEENPDSARAIQENADREAIEQADLRSHQIAQLGKELKAVDEKCDSKLQALEKNTKTVEDRLNGAIEDARSQGNAEEVQRNEDKLAAAREVAEMRQVEIEQERVREAEKLREQMERARTERAELEQYLGRDPR